MTTRRVAAALVALAAVSAADCGRAAGRADSATVGAVGDTAGTPGAAATASGPAQPVTTPASARGEAHPAPTAVRAAAESDTVRGVIRVVGSAADEQIVVRPNGGGPALTVLGAEAAMLGRLSGADVWIAGNRAAMRGFTVSRFLVRSVDGAAAIDGRLTQRNGRTVLVATGTGAEHPIANAPAALLAHVGARVWVIGALDGGAVTFGVISDR